MLLSDTRPTGKGSRYPEAVSVLMRTRCTPSITKCLWSSTCYQGTGGLLGERGHPLGSSASQPYNVELCWPRHSSSQRRNPTTKGHIGLVKCAIWPHWVPYANKSTKKGGCVLGEVTSPDFQGESGFLLRSMSGMQEPPSVSFSTLRPWTENHGKLHYQDCQWPRLLGSGDKESCLVKFSMGKGNLKEVMRKVVINTSEDHMIPCGNKNDGS